MCYKMAQIGRCLIGKSKHDVQHDVQQHFLNSQITINQRFTIGKNTYGSEGYRFESCRSHKVLNLLKIKHLKADFSRFFHAYLGNRRQKWVSKCVQKCPNMSIFRLRVCNIMCNLQTAQIKLLWQHYHFFSTRELQRKPILSR